VGDAAIVVGSEPAPFFTTPADIMRPQLSPADLHDFNHVYGDPPEVGLFSDLLAVHEPAHLYHAQSGFWFPQRWLSELFANLALEGWVREREPASLPALRTFPRCFATIDSTRFAVTALERMDQALDARPDLSDHLRLVPVHAPLQGEAGLRRRRTRRPRRPAREIPR